MYGALRPDGWLDVMRRYACPLVGDNVGSDGGAGFVVLDVLQVKASRAALTLDGDGSGGPTFTEGTAHSSLHIDEYFYTENSAALARDEQLTRIGQEAPVAKPDDIPFTTLRSGVKVKTLRPGGGDAAVTKSSTVFVEATGRLLNLNGVTFYSTKNIAGADSLGGAELKLALGSGGVVPGLEEGLVGARKNEIRRIIVPSELGYSEDPAKAAMEPNPPSVEDRRALDSVLRNPRRDAAILFDVKVVRIK